jgi:hypothetical protein
MAVSIDPRPSYMGDRMIVTGTYETADTSIDLSGLLASIDMVSLTKTGAAGPAEAYSIDGTEIKLTAATADGKFFAIGRRS